jgi:hypothetical protein
MERPSGSIDGVGSDFQPLRINDLEMVDLNCAKSNRLMSWLLEVDQLKHACAS